MPYIVEYQGQRYQYPDSTDVKAFPPGIKILQSPDLPVSMPGKKDVGDYISQGVDAGTNALIGAIHGAASGPLTGRVMKAIAPEQYANMQNETALARQRAPVPTKTGQFIGSEYSPEGAGMAALGGAASKALKGSAVKGATKFVEDKLKIPFGTAEGGVNPEALDAIRAQLGWKSVGKALVPAAGAAAGYKVGETQGHPYVGAMIGASLLGGGSSINSLHSALTAPFTSPAAKYRLMAPGAQFLLNPFTGGAIPGPDGK